MRRVFSDIVMLLYMVFCAELTSSVYRILAYNFIMLHRKNGKYKGIDKINYVRYYVHIIICRGD